MFTVTVTGLKEAILKMVNAVKQMGPILEKDLVDGANEIMAESKLEVPTDTGSLRESGFVELVARGGITTSVKIGYGGAHVVINPNTGQPTTKYALIVHEDLHAKHERGKAKYLQDPINRASEKLMNKISASISKLF